MSAFNPQQRDTPAGQVTIALYRIAQAIQRLWRVRGQAARLSPAQIDSLLFLRYARPGVRSMGGLAQRLQVSQASASGVADALEHKGLAQRAPRPTDQRVVTLTLTPAGEEQTTQLEDVLDEVMAAVASLSAGEQQALRHATQAIVQRLQQAGHVPVYEMCWGCQFFRRDAHPNDPAGPHHCAYMDAPLPEPDTYLECPDFTPPVP